MPVGKTLTRAQPSAQRTKAASLVLDYNLYPRQKVDDQHVRELVRAMEAEADFPPVVGWRSSRRVIDGFHRTLAYLHYFGEDAEIDVEWRDYESDAAAFKDAMRLNSAHGQNLSSFDRARCIILGEAFGLKAADIADALRVTPKNIEGLRERKIANIVRPSDINLPLAEADGIEVPVVQLNGVAIKRTAEHLAGTTLSTEQADAMPKLGGMRALYYVNQVITIVECGFVNPKEQRMVERLRVLREAIDDYLSGLGEAIE